MRAYLRKSAHKTQALGPVRELVAMSQAQRNATESLANALYGAPFFFSFSLSPPFFFFSGSISLPLPPSPSLFCPRSRAKSHSSSLTERSFQLFFTARPLCPRRDSSPHGGERAPSVALHEGLLRSRIVVQLDALAVSACLVIELLEIPDPFYCSFDPHPRRHEGQGGVPRYLVQVLV